MATRRPNFATVSGTIATAVIDTGTFAISYPTGFSQLSFNAGLAWQTSGHTVVYNGNDKWAYGDPGFTASFGASTITITNEAGYTLAAGTTYIFSFRVSDGSDRRVLSLPLPPLASLAADTLIEIRPGIKGYIEHAEFVVTTAVTTGSKLATLNFEIDTTNVTGGTIALTSANCTPVGATVAAAAITAANRLLPESKLSIEASSITAFSEGGGYVLAYVRPDFEDSY